MKNKSFNTYAAAFRAYTIIARTYVCYLIHNREEDIYEVIDEDTYDHYEGEFNLDFDLLHMAY